MAEVSAEEKPLFQVDVVCPKCDQVINHISGPQYGGLLMLAESFSKCIEDVDVCKACGEPGEVPGFPYPVQTAPQRPPMRCG